MVLEIQSTQSLRSIDQGLSLTAIILPGLEDQLPENPHLEKISGHLENSHEIQTRLINRNFDIMYHLAWEGVSTTYKNNRNIQIKNIQYAFTVMDLAQYFNCKRVISTGSVSEYAYIEGAVNGKQMPCPSDFYAATKVAVHTYCDLIARQNNFDFNWILIPSIYGPGRDDNNLISYTIKMLLAGNKPSYTKLEQLWDYIYIDDLIRALFLVGDRGRGTKTYVTGFGKSRPMMEYVKIIRDQINKDAELGIGDIPYKTNRIDNAIVDISELTKDTGYCPKVSFEEGIAETIKYFSAQLGV